MERKMYFTVFDFPKHIDFFDYVSSDIKIEKVERGDLRKNGITKQPFNVIHFNYFEDIADNYDDRIMDMISSMGGEDKVTELISIYGAKSCSIVLGIPRENEWVQDGFISLGVMKTLCDLKIDMQFYFT